MKMYKITCIDVIRGGRGRETGERLENLSFKFLIAKLLYKSKCPSVRMSTTFMGKRDFLGP